MTEEGIRRRIMSFRISDHEYVAVEEASRKHGFVSVSLFARAATLTCSSSEPVHSPPDVEINRLWRRIEILTTSLETLTAQFGIALDSSTGVDLLVNSNLAPKR
jgi:hypothetical protein